MNACRALVFVVSAAIGGSVWAQEPAGKDDLPYRASLVGNPAVYTAKFCSSSECRFDAQLVEWEPAGPDSEYFTVGTLDLPIGNYLVTAKLNGYNSNNARYSLECGLYNQLDGVGDWSSSEANVAGVWGQPLDWVRVGTVLTFQTPAKMPTRAGGSMTLVCRAVGQTYWTTYPPTPVNMVLWGAHITAVRVGVINER